MHLPKPLFIAFEGIDGAGKSGLAKSIADLLLEMGRKPVLTYEPTNGQYGSRIRELARAERPTAEEEYNLFLHDRLEHVRDVIVPELSAGHDVLCDRYFLSSVAYQGARGLDYRALLDDSLTRFPIPDAAIYVDISPELSRERTKKRGITDRYDDSTDFARVRDIYRALSFPWLHTVDGSPPKHLVLKSCFIAIQSLLK